MVHVPIPAAHILIALIAHIGGPLMHLSHVTLETPVQVAVADHVAQVSGGQTVHYDVTVSNPTGSETPVTVRLTLSPAVFHSVHADNAAVVANAIAWRNHLQPGETRVYKAEGILNSKVDAADLAATACVHLDAQSPAMSCATDLDIVAAQGNSRWATMALAVLLGIFAALSAIWLQRHIAPRLLTPENAAEIYSADAAGPREPDGAPSV